MMPTPAPVLSPAELAAQLDIVLDFFMHEDDAPVADLPSSYAARRRLLRALMNIRPPRPVPSAVLAAQNALLSAERRKQGIVHVMDLPTVRRDFSRTTMAHADKLCLWRGDITRLDAAAIVNAANSRMEGCWLPMHACIDNAVHSAAGVQLRQACHDMMLADHPDGVWEEPAGQARITDAYNLPGAYVIHTVGPIVSGPLTDLHRTQLASCYTSCLALAVREHCDSLAFCCISTGEFRFPKPEAADIALAATRSFLDQNPDALRRVIFDVFNEEDYGIYQKRLRI